MLAFMGCGSDEDDAAEAVREYLTATITGDGDGACERLSAEAKGVVADFAAGQLPELGTIDCGEVLSQISEFTSDEQADAAQDLIDQISGDDAEVDGERATVTAEGTNVPITLEQDAGEWKVTAETLEQSFGKNFVP